MNWPTFHIKFFSWAWNHLIWHTDCSKNPLGVLSRAWKFFWYISMFQVIKISYWTIEKWIWKITFFSSMAYTKKIRKKVSPQKIPTGSLSLVHKSYMVTEDSLPFILPIIKITLQKWTVLNDWMNCTLFLLLIIFQSLTGTLVHSTLKMPQNFGHQLREYEEEPCSSCVQPVTQWHFTKPKTRNSVSWF